MNWIKAHYEALLHAFVASVLINIALFMGVFGLGFLNWAGWFFREQSQTDVYRRWRPWTWSWDKHIEWLMPSGVGYLICIVWYFAH